MGGYRKAVAYALSGALVASQIDCAAATPLPTNVATMKSMIANLETPIYWRGGWGWRWGPGAGLFAGAVVGGAIASGAYGYYGVPYYDGYRYQPYGYDYSYSYSFSPAYYGCTTYCGYHPRYYNYW